MRDMTALAADAIEKTPPPAAADPAMVAIPDCDRRRRRLVLDRRGVRPAGGRLARYADHPGDDLSRVADRHDLGGYTGPVFVGFYASRTALQLGSRTTGTRFRRIRSPKPAVYLMS
jgi:hypothetical protein